MNPDVERRLWIAVIVLSFAAVVSLVCAFLFAVPALFLLAILLVLAAIGLRLYLKFGLKKLLWGIATLIVLAGIVWLAAWCHSNNHATIFWVVLVALIVLAPLAPLAGYYIVYGLAKANILWTIVGPPGWCRIILTWGEFARIVGPGLRWVGIPGINTLYERKMTFLKSATKKDGTTEAEPHEDDGISSFKTTRYPYALPFKDEEDKYGLHLSGLLTALGIVEDYEIAFFKVSDWYAELNVRLLSPWREFLTTISYDEDILRPNATQQQQQQARQAVCERFWRALNAPGPNNEPSVLEEIRNEVGIRVEAVELPSVDPPPGWRDITLAPYKAKKEKEAAEQQADTSAILFDDTNRALKAWLRDHTNATQEQIEKKQEELRQRALAKTSGYQQFDVKGLEGATTAVVGGGGAGIMVGSQGGGNPGSQGGGNPGSRGRKPGKAGQKRKNIGDMTEEELQREIDEGD